METFILNIAYEIIKVKGPITSETHPDRVPVVAERRTV